MNDQTPRAMFLVEFETPTGQEGRMLLHAADSDAALHAAFDRFGAEVHTDIVIRQLPPPDADGVIAHITQYEFVD